MLLKKTEMTHKVSVVYPFTKLLLESFGVGTHFDRKVDLLKKYIIMLAFVWLLGVLTHLYILHLSVFGLVLNQDHLLSCFLLILEQLDSLEHILVNSTLNKGFGLFPIRLKSLHVFLLLRSVLEPTLKRLILKIAVHKL